MAAVGRRAWLHNGRQQALRVLKIALDRLKVNSANCSGSGITVNCIRPQEVPVSLHIVMFF